MIKKLCGLGDRLQSFSCLAAFLTRFIIGYVFVTAGWGKFQNMSQVVEFFTSIGIPLPHLQAPFVASVEFLGGLCLILGLCSRVVTLPLMVVMMVALRTAHWDAVEGLASLAEQDVFLYIILLFWIFIYGPGKLAIDHWLKQRLCRS